MSYNRRFSRIEQLTEKQLAGKRLSMSLVNNRTAELWASFMPVLKKSIFSSNPDLYSLQVYPPDYFLNFNPAAEFEKWALAEVEGTAHLPEGIERFKLPAGSYAVFNHIGDVSTFPETLQYIFNEWMPQSGYQLDNRPHFELLGSRYRNNDPSSEEEVWIPVY